MKKSILLKRIILENFKCYKKATIDFKATTIIVGENNAGKSCLIEALRLVSRAGQGAKHRIYTQAPLEFDLPARTKGFPIETQKLKIDLGIIIYNYNSSPYAKIKAIFADDSSMEIYLNTNKAFAVLYDELGNLIKTKQQASKYVFDKLSILPQIGPIRENEKLYTSDTVQGDKDTYLSSRHFRNEIYLNKTYFDDFKTRAEKTWPSLKVSEPEYALGRDEYISLYVQDNNFAAEIGKMGNGIQMWLQIMWFISRSADSEVVILDEPDVYMHPDMQIKLLNIISIRPCCRRFQHSVANEEGCVAQTFQSKRQGTFLRRGETVGQLLQVSPDLRNG